MEPTIIRFPSTPQEHVGDPAHADFARWVRDALRHLYDPVYLQTHPLTRLVPEPHTTPLSAGKRLRQLLLDAIAALRPESRSGDARASRQHDLLTLRYVEALGRDDVCGKVAISRREYDRQHRQALDAVVSLLQDSAAIARPSPPDPSTSTGDSHAPSTGPLPRPWTSFIGREREMREIFQLIQSARLVTLTGPPGTGKTRLALQVARELATASARAPAMFPDGVSFAPLAPFHDPALVVSAIAQTLGVREVPNRSLIASLVDHLSHRRSLLLLDNFEHLLAAAPVVSHLLTACPNLTVLVTSRASLRLSGEHDFRVPPLGVPAHSGLVPLEQLARCEAVCLYVERARAVQSGFCLTEQNAPAVMEICSRLDGLPLAIELASARVRVLTPQAMLRRLQRRLPLLTGGARDLPARQQTMQAAIAWSYDLLMDDEQILYRRLSVFAGGFTLEAAEAVCNLDGMPTDLLDGVTSMVDKSLVRQEDVAGEARFSMLQTMREYGLERLEESGEAEVLRRRYAAFFVELAEKVEREALCTGPGSVYRRAEAERDNFRAALDWSQAEQGDTEMGLRLVAALPSFWLFGEYAAEGRARAAAILARPDAAQYPQAWAGALITVGALEQQRSAHAQALARLHESLPILRGTQDRLRLSQACVWLGMTAMGQGDTQTASRWFSECRDLARTENLPWAEATALSFMAETLLLHGDLDQVRSLAEEAVDRYRALHDGWGTARMQRFLAGIAWMEGDYATAHSLCAEAVTLLRDVGERWNLARALTRMGIILLDEAQYQEAEDMLRASLLAWRDLGNDAGMILCLAGLTAVAAAQGQTERAQRLYAAEPFDRSAGGLLLDTLSYLEFDHVMDRIRAQLGDRPPRDVPITLEEAVSDALETPSTAVSR